MNQKEWSSADSSMRQWEYYHSVKKIQKSLIYNPNPDAIIVHHLRDTEEQRKYNDEHYEFWGFNQDGTFEYGKYVIFVTKEEHHNIHSMSDETKHKMSISRRGYLNPMYGKTGERSPHYGKHRSLATKKKLHDAQVGNKSYWYGRHRSENTRIKISNSVLGNKNPFYGKHHSVETRLKLSASKLGKNNPNYGKPRSEETKQKISESQKGYLNHNYGKKTPEDVLNKMKETHKLYSIAYKEYKLLCGTLSWNEFQKAVKNGSIDMYMYITRCNS